MEAQVTQEAEAILEALEVIVAQEVTQEAAQEVVRRALREVGQCLATEVEASPVVGAPVEAEVIPFRDRLADRLADRPLTQNDSNQIDLFLFPRTYRGLERNHHAQHCSR